MFSCSQSRNHSNTTCLTKWRIPKDLQKLDLMPHDLSLEKVLKPFVKLLKMLCGLTRQTFCVSHYIWCTSNTAFQKKNFTPTVECGGGSVVVWGWFPGPGRLSVITTTCCLPKTPEVRPPVRDLKLKQTWFLQQTMNQNTPASPPLNSWGKPKWRLWSCLVKVLAWILLRCCGVTLKRWVILENPPMWLNYNNSANMSGPKFPSGALRGSLQVIANIWLQLFLLGVAPPVM